MNQKISLTKLIIFIGLIGSGYIFSQDEKAPQPAQEQVAVEKSDIILCGHCGEIKGSEKCCKEAKVCSCGAHKGSPACCKIKLAGKDVVLCNDCGHEKGSKVCCAEDAVKCDSCKKAKGSPGCCLKVDTKVKPIKTD